MEGSACYPSSLLTFKRELKLPIFLEFCENVRSNRSEKF